MIHHRHHAGAGRSDQNAWVTFGESGWVSFGERRSDYRGFVSFEWEKRWHAQIPEPEVALPHFMQWMRAALEA
jgi:hypothetical protein